MLENCAVMEALGVWEHGGRRGYWAGQAAGSLGCSNLLPNKGEDTATFHENKLIE